MRNKRKIIGMDCSDIRFCCGPCNSTVEEHADCIFLKPNDGQRYARFTWNLFDGTIVDLRNVRMCRSCCHRYTEMHDAVGDHDFEAIEMMQRDAQAVLTKLKMNPTT